MQEKTCDSSPPRTFITSKQQQELVDRVQKKLFPALVIHICWALDRWAWDKWITYMTFSGAHQGSPSVFDSLPSDCSWKSGLSHWRALVLVCNLTLTASENVLAAERSTSNVFSGYWSLSVRYDLMVMFISMYLYRSAKWLSALCSFASTRHAKTHLAIHFLRHWVCLISS